MILIIKHIEIEGPGTLGEFFKETGWKTKVVELGKGDTFPSMDECEAIVSLGGPMNVYETHKYPFLEKEDALLKEALKEEVPVLGICLGAQLLAKAAGAKVRKAKQKEIGWYKVDLTQESMNDPLLKGLGKSLKVFQWHEDTFDIPAGGVRLAESQACANQAFRIGPNAYGLQFHIEITPEMVESWINKYMKNNPSGFSATGLLSEVYKRADTLRTRADMVYRNFSGSIRVPREIGTG